MVGRKVAGHDDGDDRSERDVHDGGIDEISHKAEPEAAVGRYDRAGLGQRGGGWREGSAAAGAEAGGCVHGLAALVAKNDGVSHTTKLS